jgi:hypothetical protein
MHTTTSPALSPRDRAVLRAVAAGRCEISGRLGGALVVDGLFLSDQFAGHRLAGAGLIARDPQLGEAVLTPSGRALLAAA